jgi:hypothetical protein
MKKKLFFLLFFFNPIFSQETVEVAYKHLLNDNSTYNQEVQKALNLAKIEALRKGHISENIQSFEILSKSETNDQFDEKYNKEIILNINGKILDWEYIKQPSKNYDEKDNNYYIEFTIKAKVMQYHSNPDPNFSARIEGIKHTYTSDKENIEFNVIPNIDCYLKIFYIDSKQAQILYPAENINKGKTYRFLKDKKLTEKSTRTIDYISPSTDKPIEQGKIILLFTKKQIEFTDVSKDEEGFFTVTEEGKIYDWIMKLEPEDKYLSIHPVVITQK